MVAEMEEGRWTTRFSSLKGRRKKASERVRRDKKALGWQRDSVVRGRGRSYVGAQRCMGRWESENAIELVQSTVAPDDGNGRALGRPLGISGHVTHVRYDNLRVQRVLARAQRLPVSSSPGRAPAAPAPPICLSRSRRTLAALALAPMRRQQHPAATHGGRRRQHAWSLSDLTQHLFVVPLRMPVSAWWTQFCVTSQ